MVQTNITSLCLSLFSRTLFYIIIFVLLVCFFCRFLNWFSSNRMKIVEHFLFRSISAWDTWRRVQLMKQQFNTKMNGVFLIILFSSIARQWSNLCWKSAILHSLIFVYVPKRIVSHSFSALEWNGFDGELLEYFDRIFVGSQINVDCYAKWRKGIISFDTLIFVLFFHFQRCFSLLCQTFAGLAKCERDYL